MNWYNADDAKKIIKGQVLQYLDADGNAWLIWTVEGKHLTGTAILSGDDQERLFQWWASTGSLHPAD